MGVQASSAGTSSPQGRVEMQPLVLHCRRSHSPGPGRRGPTRRGRPLHFPGVLSPPVVCGVIRVAAHHGQLFLA